MKSNSGQDVAPLKSILVIRKAVKAAARIRNSVPPSAAAVLILEFR